MFNQPQRAKRLFFDVIPKAADEYLAHVDKASALQKSIAEGSGSETQDADRLALYANPAWFLHAGHIPDHAGSPLSFGMLLNLASVANAETPDVMWGFIKRYDANVSPETHPMLATLVERAIVFYATLSDRLRAIACRMNRSTRLWPIWRRLSRFMRAKRYPPMCCRIWCSRSANVMRSSR